jgi:hypothetical protein
MEKTKILIVCPLPQNKDTVSRSFESLFHFWDKNTIATIFSDSRDPVKGNCQYLFQITDKRLIAARIFQKADVGRQFVYDDLPESWLDSQKNSGFHPRKKTSLLFLLRKLIWKKKYWDTEKLELWVRSFKPDVLLVAFSYDFYEFDIAEHFSREFKIPIIVTIYDDYFFNDHFSLSPFYWIYRSIYTSRVKKFMSKNVFCVFVSEKIKNLYSTKFPNKGIVVHIGSSNIGSINLGKPLKQINSIRYFGNLEAGRFKSICEIGKVLLKLGSRLTIDVFSSDSKAMIHDEKPSNVMLNEPLAYNEMLKLMCDTDLLVAVEGFSKKSVKAVKYSLSTKTGDLLASGKPILVYGSEETGLLSFFIENKCGIIATSKEELFQKVRDLLSGNIDLTKILATEQDVADKLFSTEKQAKLFEDFVKDILKAANKTGI